MEKSYLSKDNFERTHKYVTVIFSKYQPASIENSYTSKKNAETAVNNKKAYGTVLTRKQAVLQIATWNTNHNF